MDPAPRLLFSFLAAARLLAAPMSWAQAPEARASIQVGPNTRVSADSFTRPLVEPHFAADPRNASHLVAAAIVATPAAAFRNELYCAAFASFDGGRSWSSHAFGPRQCGDPWLTIGLDGTAYAVMIGNREDTTGQRFGVFLYRSEDGGRTWPSEPTFFAGGHDHPAVAVDATGGRFGGRLYVISGRGRRLDGKVRWTVFVARSADGGRTFSEPLHITPSNLNLNSDNGVVLSDGTLALTYTEFQRNVDDFTRAGILDRRHTWVVTSADGGEHFSIPLFVSESCGSGFKTLSVDASTGRFRDRLYLVCTKPGGNGIYLYSSGDAGERWSDPVRVDSPGDSNDMRRTPTVAVNTDGVLGVAWYDRRNDPARRCQDIYFAASLDGGASFLPEVRVSDAPSCPATPRNGAAADRWPAGSDYGAMVVTPDGRFRVLWADSRSGIYELWMATVTVQARAR